MRPARGRYYTVVNDTSSFEWILSRLPTERPLRVLDVGCGDCPEAPALLAAGVELTGIDTDERAIVRARTTSPAAAFVCADAATLMPGSAPFDVVLLRRPELAASPGTWRRIISSIPSWLSPRGRVIVSTPGPSEAEATGRWLDEAGLATAPAVQLGAEEERYVVTAARPVPANEPTTPVVWEDDSELGVVCDLATGTCTMPASPPEKEEHDGEG